MHEPRNDEDCDGLVRALCNLMEDPVAIADAACSFQWADDAFPQLFGRTREDFLGRTPTEISPDPQTSPESLDRIRDALLEGGGPVEQRIVVNSRGEPFWVLVKVDAVFGAGGEITHYVTTAREVSWAQREDPAEGGTGVAVTVCASCRKVRGADGVWRSPECSGTEASSPQSHGSCPACLGAWE